METEGIRHRVHLRKTNLVECIKVEMESPTRMLRIEISGDRVTRLCLENLLKRCVWMYEWICSFTDLLVNAIWIKL